MEVKEVVFDFVGFVNKFVGPSLVDNLCYLLSDYRRNDPALQTAIVSFGKSEENELVKSKISWFYC